MKINALAIFHHPPGRLNCAQSVLHGYQAVTGDTSIPQAAFARLTAAERLRTRPVDAFYERPD